MTPGTEKEVLILDISGLEEPLEYVSQRLTEYMRDARERFLREVNGEKGKYRLIVKSGELGMVQKITLI